MTNENIFDEERRLVQKAIDEGLIKNADSWMYSIAYREVMARINEEFDETISDEEEE